MRLAQVVAPEDAGLIPQFERLADRTEVQRELVQLTIIGRGQRRIPVEVSWRSMVSAAAEPRQIIRIVSSPPSVPAISLNCARSIHSARPCA